jgi:hypothetical protein
VAQLAFAPDALGELISVDEGPEASPKKNTMAVTAPPKASPAMMTASIPMNSPLFPITVRRRAQGDDQLLERAPLGRVC